MERITIKEGMTKKGGVNTTPPGSRPPDPCGQSVKASKKYHKKKDGEG